MIYVNTEVDRNEDILTAGCVSFLYFLSFLYLPYLFFLFMSKIWCLFKWMKYSLDKEPSILAAFHLAGKGRPRQGIFWEPHRNFTLVKMFCFWGSRYSESFIYPNVLLYFWKSAFSPQTHRTYFFIVFHCRHVYCVAWLHYFYLSLRTFTHSTWSCECSFCEVSAKHTLNVF